MQPRNNEDNLNPQNSRITPPENVGDEGDSPFRTDSQGSRGSSSRQSSGGKTNWFILLGVLILAVVASYLLASYSYVKVSDDKKNWSGYTTTINQLTTDLKTIQTNLNNITTTVNGVSGQVNSSVQASLASVYDQLKKDEAKVDSLSSQLSTIQSGASSNSTNIANLQTSINDLKAQIKTDSDTVTALKKTVDSLVSDVATLKTQMTGVLTPTTTPTTTGVVGTNVYATVLGNTFTGNKFVNVPAQAVSTTQTQTFNFSITNATGKAVSEIQLAVALGLYDASGITSYVLPAGTTVTINLNGYLASFTQQTTGIGSVLGYVNTVTTGVFGGMGNISQPAGVANYTVTVTITTGSANALPAFIIMPNVQVVSYK